MAEDTRIVISAIDRTSKGFKSVGAGLGRITKSIFSMKTALIGVAGVAGFGYLVKSSLNATDSLAKTASKIGTTTEALSKLQYAAKISGVETNTLNMAMQRFTRRTAEAAQGTGEAKGAIKELGLDARKLQQLPLDQQMMKLAGAFGNVQSDADKLRIAFKLFDSEGAALVNTLALGEEGLEKLFGRAKALGIVMSGEAADGAQKANDALTDLFSIAKGLKDQFSAALAPAIERVAKMLTDFFLKTSKAEGGIEKFARNMAKSFLNATVNVVKAMKGILEAVDNAINFITAKVDGVRLNFLEDELKYAQGNAELFQSAYETIAGGGRLSGKDTLKLRLKGVKKDLASVDEAWSDSVSAAAIAKMEIFDIKGRKAVNFADMLDVDDFDYVDFIAGLTESIDNLGTSTVKSMEPAAESLNNFEQGFKSFSGSIPSMDENLKSLTVQGLNGLTDALAAGVTGAANFKDAMKSMAKSVVDSLIKMLIQKYIVDAAFGAITASFGNGNVATGTYNSGMNVGGPVNGGGSMAGANAGGGGFGHRAIGGSVQAGQPYMVGERGQEMFVPNQSGSIIPNNKMGGGSGVVVNQTINISTGVAQTVRAEVANLMPQIASAAKGAVADARQRGGGYSQALIGA